MWSCSRSNSWHVFTNCPNTNLRTFSPIFLSWKRKQIPYWSKKAFFCQFWANHNKYFITFGRNNSKIRENMSRAWPLTFKVWFANFKPHSFQCCIASLFSVKDFRNLSKISFLKGVRNKQNIFSNIFFPILLLIY